MNTRILKAAVAITCVFIGHLANAESLTYSNWQQASEQWKRGYAYAVLSYQTTIAYSNSPEHMRITAGFQECAGEITDAAFVQVIDHYFIRHPEAITEPFIGATLNSLAEVCKPYLDQNSK